ncbi:MAG TPA: M20/M25/M40 family metallo-hydrolase, partial [Humisphaera sp.]|nr:M20/M25/M40 family metallo-hydrolase [Humisphaera sp.]
TSDEQPPVQMDPDVCAALRRAAGALPETVSAALHDAAVLAPLLLTAMLFVASKYGISHNPAEFSRIEDITAAARVLEKLVAEGWT